MQIAPFESIRAATRRPSYLKASRSPLKSPLSSKQYPPRPRSTILPALHDLLVEVRHRQDDAFPRPLADRIARDGERLERNSGRVGALKPGESSKIWRVGCLQRNPKPPQVRLNLFCSKLRSRFWTGRSHEGAMPEGLNASTWGHGLSGPHQDHGSPPTPMHLHVRVTNSLTFGDTPDTLQEGARSAGAQFVACPMPLIGA